MSDQNHYKCRSCKLPFYYFTAETSSICPRCKEPVVQSAPDSQPLLQSSRPSQARPDLPPFAPGGWPEVIAIQLARIATTAEKMLVRLDVLVLTIEKVIAEQTDEPNPAAPENEIKIVNKPSV